jgi:uncharacterized delta-60 repeat protein
MATKAFSSAKRLVRSKVWMLMASMLLAVLLASRVALAAAGDLDPSFGEGGKVVIPLPTAFAVNDVAVQRADGKIVIAGSSGDRFSLMRLLPDGSPDVSFGGGDGVVTTNLTTKSDVATDVLVQPDGKIVTAGYGGRNYARTLILVRYKPDGTLDESFGGGDGRVFTKPPGVTSTSASALVRLPGSGKLVAAGNAGAHVLLIRYLADGRRDKSFGRGDGIVITDFKGRASALARQKNNGKLVIAGSTDGLIPFAGYKPVSFLFIRRLSDGSPDKSFSSDGKKIVDISVDSTDASNYEIARAIILRPDGKIVAAGVDSMRYYSNGETAGGLQIVRLEPNGTLDGRVAGGMVPDGAYDLLRQQDGKLIAVGTNTVGYDDGSGYYQTIEWSFALRRYNPNGSLDASFGSGGEVLTNFGGENGHVYAYAGALAEGKVVAAGNYSYATNGNWYGGIVLARYLTD